MVWRGGLSPTKAGTTYFINAHAADIDLKFVLCIKTHPFVFFVFIYFPFWAFREFLRSPDRMISDAELMLTANNLCITTKQAYFYGAE